ncbi:MAG: NPCBM/NEW2 domain-containing protein [Planctomycetota bacterium]|nr:NPCBM/NEW2 domain-containing protein [Planctomycetota bacterium]
MVSSFLDRRRIILYSILALVILATVLVKLYGVPRVVWKSYRWRDKQIVPIDILSLLNNDGIARAERPRDGNLNRSKNPLYMPGMSYSSSGLPKPGELVELGTSKFLFPSSKTGALNNVRCRGQWIRHRTSRYRSMDLLIASHGGRIDTELLLKYGRDLVPARMTVPDWQEVPDAAGLLSLASRGSFRPVDNSGLVEKVEATARIWRLTIPLDDSRRLSSFRLPWNGKLHLFAISMVPFKSKTSLRESSDLSLLQYQRLAKITPIDRLEFADRAHQLQLKLDEARKDLRRRSPRETDCVDANVGYLTKEIDGLVRSGRIDEKRFLDHLGTTTAELGQLLLSQNPFPKKRGNFLRAYRSEIDDSLQTYSISVPEDYEADQAHLLFLSLHGHGWYRPYQGHPTFLSKGAIVVSPHGRGSQDYMFVAEEDILAVLQDVLRDYSVDEDRIIMMGHSMGGTGSWNIGTKYPHLFAGIAPNAGNSHRGVWEALWGWGLDSPPGPLESLPMPFNRLCLFVADTIDPISFAENLLNLPVFCIHGVHDGVVPVGHARGMVERLRRLGSKVIYREDPNAGHGGFKSAFIAEQWRWVWNQRRDLSPWKIRHRTWKLKYGRAYWLRIQELELPARFSEIEAESTETRLFIRTSNVRAFSIDWSTHPKGERGKGLEILIDGQSVPLGGDSLFRRSSEGIWAPAAPASGLTKRPYLEGPIEDAYTTPFMLVYGTGGSSDSSHILRAEAQRYLRDWKLLFNVPCRIKSDRDVSQEDIELYSLILYGNREENQVYSRIYDQLPIRVNSQEVSMGDETWKGEQVGAKFCFPNPLNPQRYVCVFAGTAWKGSYGINNRFGNWFHWGPFDNRSWFDFVIFDERTNSSATAVAVGYFDQDWQRLSAHTYRGDRRLRNLVHARKPPKYLSVPENERIYLSDVVPSHIDQHKGNVNADRSFRGNLLSIGGLFLKDGKEENNVQLFDRGFGIRAPSSVEFNLGGRFERFHAFAGIDLEGSPGRQVRLHNERINFEVWGDDRLLAATRGLQWKDRAAEIEVGIKGIKKLKLKAIGHGARWHFGSAAWGDVYVE